MAIEVTSQHLGGSAELTVVMPIKPGFVDVRDTRTFATRLRILLRALNGIRKRGIEREPFRSLSGPVERIRTIKEIRWLIFDNDTKLLLAVAFDRPWEPYIRKIARDAGPVLDAILCNCEGYTENGHASELGYAGFAQWVRQYQKQPDFYYTAEPYQTVDDAAYLRVFEQAQRNNPDPESFDRQEGATMSAPDPQVEALKSQKVDRKKALQQGLLTLHTMFRLTELYPQPDPGSKNRDHIFLLKLAQAILEDFDEKPLGSIPERHKRAIEWLRSKPHGFTMCKNHSEQVEYSDADVQGDIITSIEGMNHGCLLLMQISDASEARRFLQSEKFLSQLTRQSTDPKTIHIATNIAFTFQGLRTLGLPDEMLETFPKEFREGMEARGAMLGDVRFNHADNWVLPQWHPNGRRHPEFSTVRLSTVDLIIKLQICSEHNDDHLPADLEKERDRLATIDGLELLAVEPLWRNQVRIGGKKFVREHFGFVDGLSQPVVAPDADMVNPIQTSASKKYSDDVPRGELLLGYNNAQGDAPETNELLINGTFEVIRKLRQNVGALNEFLSKAATGLSGSKKDTMIDLWQSKMMGRDLDGVPATNKSLVHSSNTFDYENDPEGKGCPLQSHIRRANPREQVDGQAVPRIMRRGYSYGPSFNDNQQANRGLMFMAYNASIADQYEVIQRWISGGNSTGVLSDQFDPFLGVPVPNKPHTYKFLHNRSAKRADLNQRKSIGTFEPFVKLEWGMYLFVPSPNVLAKLDSFVETANTALDELVAAGQETIEKLNFLATIKDASSIAAHWKQLFEDLSSKQAGKAREVWAAVRHKHNGVLDTPYGVLVARNDQVMEVFANHETYSVREYWHRMNASIGEIFLGMDPRPGSMPVSVKSARDIQYEQRVTATDYADQATLVNDVIYAVSEQQAFDLTVKVAKQTLVGWFKQSPAPTAIDLRKFYADKVLAGLSKEWFGLPDGNHMEVGGFPVDSEDVHCPYHFLAPSRYIFPPNPGAFGSTLAQEHGKQLLEGATRYIADLRQGKGKAGTVLQVMFHDLLNPGITDKRVSYFAKTLIGVMHGFLPTCYGNFLSVMHTWMSDESLWRLQQSLFLRHNGDKFDGANSILRNKLIDAMQQRPIPETLHRKAMADTSLDGTPIAAGSTVVVGVMSGCHEQIEQGVRSTHTIFGGDYAKKATSEAPVHACPGQPMAMGVLIGMISALLEYGTWNSSPVPLVLNRGS